MTQSTASAAASAAASVAAFVVELPVDRFVDELFPPLAWEATVRLADPVVGSRLVERVLRLAWDERGQFATPDLLYQHVRRIARAAIEHEAARRRETIRFDNSNTTPLPGDLQLMTVESVRQRFQAGSPHPIAFASQEIPAAMDAPPPLVPDRPLPRLSTFIPAVAAPTSAPVTALAPPLPPSPPPHPDARVGHESSAQRGSDPAPAHRELVHPASAHTADGQRPTHQSSTVARWAAKSASQTAAETAHAHAEQFDHSVPKGHHLRAADYIKQHEGVPLPRRIIGGIAGVVVALGLAWRYVGAAPTVEQAVAALADTSGVSSATKPAQQLDVLLPGGVSVHLGANAAQRSSRGFADGARALHLSGPAEVAIDLDSTKPTAIATGSHRWMTYGVKAAFDRDGDRTIVQVDSGSLELISDSVHARVATGSSVAVDRAGVVTALSASEREMAFGWRSGRLMLVRQPSQRVVRDVEQWYDLAVRFDPLRAPSESLSINVPLDAVDSLIGALATAVGGTVERAGRQLTVKATPATAAAVSRRAGPGRSSLQARPLSTRASRRADARATVPDLKLPDIRLPEIKLPASTTKPPNESSPAAARERR